MRYAVIQTGGKQYRVSEGDVLEVERLSDGMGKTVTFQDILLYVSQDPENILIGKPYVSGVSITATILADNRGEKIRVAKFKAKARYRKVTGHRQALSTIKIEKILSGKEEKVKETTKTAPMEEKTVKKAATRKTTVKKV